MLRIRGEFVDRDNCCKCGQACFVHSGSDGHRYCANCRDKLIQEGKAELGGFHTSRRHHCIKKGDTVYLQAQFSVTILAKLYDRGDGQNLCDVPLKVISTTGDTARVEVKFNNFSCEFEIDVPKYMLRKDFNEIADSKDEAIPERVNN